MPKGISALSLYRSNVHGKALECSAANTDLSSSSVRLIEDRTDRLCLVCKSLNSMQDEQQFVFDCSSYSHNQVTALDLLPHHVLLPVFSLV